MMLSTESLRHTHPPATSHTYPVTNEKPRNSLGNSYHFSDFHFSNTSKTAFHPISIRRPSYSQPARRLPPTTLHVRPRRIPPKKQPISSPRRRPPEVILLAVRTIRFGRGRSNGRRNLGRYGGRAEGEAD